MTELTHKNLLGDISHIVMSEEALSELIDDYGVEFEMQLYDFGRNPTRNDIEEYLNLPVYTQKSFPNGQKYKLFKEA